MHFGDRFLVHSRPFIFVVRTKRDTRTVSTSTAAIICSIAGGGCELGGLVIVVAGILRDRQRADDLLRRTSPREPPERSYPSPFPTARTARRPWQGVTSYGQKHEMEQIRNYIEQLDTSAANGLLQVQKYTDAGLDGLSEALVREGPRPTHCATTCARSSAGTSGAGWVAPGCSLRGSSSP